MPGVACAQASSIKISPPPDFAMRKATKLVYPVSTSRKTTTVIRRTMNKDAWNPEQYERFKNERSQPVSYTHLTLPTNREV